MMKDKTLENITELVSRYNVLSGMEENLAEAVGLMTRSYKTGGKVLTCGNGGSAADAEHIVGELMKGFIYPRPLTADLRQKLKDGAKGDNEEAAYLSKYLQMPLPAISLVSSVALPTAFANDQAPDLTFAQQVLGLGKEGDVLIAISTSGNSANVLHAACVAKALNLKVIALTGKSGGKLKNFADLTLAVPETETYRIQELHLPIYHMLCMAVEEEFFGGETS